MSDKHTSETLALETIWLSVAVDAGHTAEVFARQFVVAQNDAPHDWLGRVLDKLQRLATLGENWDSYGAAPVDHDSIREAQKLVEHLAMYVGVDEPAVGATPDGEAGLSWDGGPWSLDVDVTRDGRYEYVFLDDRDSTLSIEASTRDKDDLLIRLTTW